MFLVPVDTIKILQTIGQHVTSVLLHVLVVQQKQQLVLQLLIVYVLRLKILVLVRMVQLPLVQLVLPMVPTFVRPVPVDITKMVTRVLDVDLLVVTEKEKQLLVRLHRIVFVQEIPVLVQMVQLPLVQLVLPMVPAFVRPVPVDISKMITTFVPFSHRRIIP